jgi:hypothetical protein
MKSVQLSQCVEFAVTGQEIEGLNNINNGIRSSNNNTQVLIIIKDQFLTLNFSNVTDS